ncbi:MAG: hypothetical protein ACE5JP_08790 [Candidatus Bipolaricaulia bacterium]
MSVVHIFPDAKSMELHMQGVGEIAKKAYEFMEIVSFEIYGKPSDTVLEAMKKIAGSGVTFRWSGRRLGRTS